MPDRSKCRRLIRRVAVVVFACFAHTHALAQSTQPTPPGPAVQAVPKLPNYPDSAEGLTTLAQDVLAAMKNNDAATTNAYINSLVLPKPDSWFADAFEKNLAKESAAEYTEMIPALPAIVAAAFRDVANSDATVVKGYRFESTCDPEMDGNIIVLLSMRKRSKPLYEIRYSAPGLDRGIWAFAYVDGGFRYVGNTNLGFGSRLKELARAAASGQNEPSPEDKGPVRVRVGGNIQASKMIHQTAPVYPAVAKDNHVQGTVVLHAIIGKDGAVRQIQVKQGPCMLDQSAIKAVRQWKYSPTLINGNPVEIDTTISVVYTLRD